MHAPTAVCFPFDPLYFGLREDGRATRRGQRQIVHVERVLGADVAAGDAIAAVGAGVLVDTLRIEPGGEVNGEVQRLGVAADLNSTALESLHFSQLGGARMLSNVECRLGEFVVFSKFG